jgi:malonyl CoA-acyl carrier protein transacylase
MRLLSQRLSRAEKKCREKKGQANAVQHLKRKRGNFRLPLLFPAESPYVLGFPPALPYPSDEQEL